MKTLAFMAVATTLYPRPRNRRDLGVPESLRRRWLSAAPHRGGPLHDRRPASGGGADGSLVTAGTTLPGQDIYAIRYVRPGSYYVAAFLFEGGSPIAIGVLKGMDNEARLITVTDQTLTGLDFHLQSFDFGEADPIDALDALAVVRPVMQTERPDARPIVLEGSNPTMPPTGLSDEWLVVFVADSDSMVYFFETRGDRIGYRETFRYAEIPEDERPDMELADMKSIPATAIGSQQAFGIALANGMQEQLTAFPGGFEYHVRVGYVLSPFHTEYPGLVDAASGAFIGRSYRSEANHSGAPLEFIGSNPAPKSVNVPLETQLEFTFNGPLDIHHLQMNRDLDAVPRPHVHSVELSPDQRTIRLSVTHNPGTDYTWFFPDIRSDGRGTWCAARRRAPHSCWPGAAKSWTTDARRPANPTTGCSSSMTRRPAWWTRSSSIRGTSRSTSGSI